MLLNELYVFLRLDLIIQQVKGNIPADDERLLDSLDKVKQLAFTLKKSESFATA